MSKPKTRDGGRVQVAARGTTQPVQAAVWFAAGLAYFALYGRHHLVWAPEEASAEEGE